VIDTLVGEVCDDGDQLGGDGCAADCRSGEVCGNGIIDAAAGEVCDDSDQIGGDGCSANCRSDETCGNSVIDTPVGEVCDDGGTVGGDGCNSTCTSTVEVTRVTVGFGDTCAVLSDGRGYCWGVNYDNTLGVGNLGNPVRTPKQILTNRTDWVAIYNGADGDDAHRCGLTKSQALHCWGANGSFGKVGNGATNTFVTSPYAHTNTWRSVAAARGFTVGIRADGTFCHWGVNRGTTPLCTTTGWGSVAGFYDHVCLIKTDGSLWCAGSGTDGKLGRGDIVGNDTPQRVQLATDWLAVAAGGSHTCGIRGTNGQGSLWCWGDNEYGQLGFASAYTNDGTVNFQDNVTLPQQVGTDTSWVAVSAGLDHVCAIKADDSMWCWGQNNRGQLGLDDTTIRTQPTRVAASSQWTAVAAGKSYSCALQVDGSVFCFGSNSFGEAGQPPPAPTSVLSPLRVTIP